MAIPPASEQIAAFIVKFDPTMERLIRAALAQAKTPMPRTGRGRTIVTSISARQRPRRARAR